MGKTSLKKQPVAKKIKTKVMIVDDHPVVRRGLRMVIEAEPDLYICGESGDTREAIELFQRSSPDVVVVDISIKGGSGIELLKQMRAMNSTVRLLVSSMHDENTFAERALHAGAMGYVSKDEAPDKIVLAIRSLLAGKIFLSPQMTERMMSRLAYGKPEEDRPLMETLSDRELEVFQLIGKGLGTRQVAENLHLSPKTVETHRESIKKKLNLRDGSELMRQAVRWMIEQGG